MFFCLSLREIHRDALKMSFESCFKEFAKIRERRFQTQSRCRYCGLRQFCSNCPGKAYLETQDMEAPAEWACELTHLSCGKTKEPVSV
jgi:radical SAM protein with 4Fe4S-binding SPASM domain